MWHNGLQVHQTFASHHSQNAWVLLSSPLGWKKIKPNAADGCTCLFVMFNLARALGRPVNVFVDNNEITIAYML